MPEQEPVAYQEPDLLVPMSAPQFRAVMSHLDSARFHYQQKIERCQDFIDAGESPDVWEQQRKWYRERMEEARTLYTFLNTWYVHHSL